ncbi:Glycosyltransferase, GT2 family [Rosenbergiella nectarea]|uniref:Glycosyltransferase, GT2 family n=1 Tax=Rosenbergiella nectarea TaxID=988801 RepID=A0A1H9DAL3_9GAMM|nr:glycosyltransferase [Rosenbergiella nectarea]SEQ10515.1 Glycosyltransferase, GT2 family [Rosenbergiella nectarea]
MKKVLIITPDIEGPVRNGGIGTAFTALATALASKSIEVDILYTSGDYSESSESFSEWSNLYSTFGVRLLQLYLKLEFNIDAPYFRKKSYALFNWLIQNQDYDTVIACEWQADLYYSLLSKSNGTNFENIKFIVNTHGSTLWADEGNYHLPDDQNHLELYYMEKSVVEMADEVVSPSQYLLDWMQEKGWQLPENSKVILNCAPFNGFKPQKNKVSNSGADVSGIELVFFGRLETRKGLDIFLKSINKLNENDIEKLTGITFIGKDVNLCGTNSSTLIKSSTRKINTVIKIINGLDRTSSNAYLKKENVLVVIPSLVENSPYTVYECLINDIDFISSNVGGIPELIPKETHVDILFSPNPVELHGKIHSRLNNLSCKPGLISEQDTITASWKNSVEAKSTTRFIKIDSSQQPLVSVCLVHHDRHHLLQQAIASLKTQSYKNVEVILVDDGSSALESKQYLDLIENDFLLRNWKIIKSSNNYLGAARNLAARHASGDFLLFMDDDNVAKPFEIETFVIAALNSGADILTTPSDLIFGEEFPSPFRKMTNCWLPLGPDLNIAGFNNCFGDANAMVKKSVFDIVGGFTEDYGLGHEDWEFFLKASLAGYKLQVVPESLFWYRVANTGMLLTGNKKKNNYRSLRPFLAQRVNYNYGTSLIPSYLEKIHTLEEENQRLKNVNGMGSLSNQINTISSKVDLLISQQREGWAHDRFTILSEQLDHLTSQQREGWAHDRFEVLFNKLNSTEQNNSGAFSKIIRKLKNLLK